MQLDVTTREGAGHGQTSIGDLAMVGEELTDDDLRLAAGGETGETVVDVKSYKDGVYVDHEIWIF